MAPATCLIIPLLAGYMLDLLLGDPSGWPHPIRLFGSLISRGERLMNRPPAAFFKGMGLTLALCIATFFFFETLLHFLSAVSLVLYLIVSSVLVFYGLANRQLVLEGRQVSAALEISGPAAGRMQLSRIVGRDTAGLGAQQIRIAVLETLSENLSDGVIAPLFYYALAGVPGMMTYKMINTLDSMIGYRNPRYEYFGKFAALLDDLVNWVPARLTAFLMVLTTVGFRGVKASLRSTAWILRYGHRHKSPNAGYPEAALAGILDARFGGPNTYGGILVDKPFIGSNDRVISRKDIHLAGAINHGVCLLMVVLIIALILKCHQPYPWQNIL